MGLGQTMITAAFLVLLSVAILSANRMVIESEELTHTAAAFEHAANIGQALLTEISRKKFDEKERRDVYQKTTDFTASGSLGPDAGETVSTLPESAPFKSQAVYDDVDDYHGYRRTVTLADIPGFQVSVKVQYVSATDLSTKVTSQTYFKRADVTVYHPDYLDPVTFSTLLTY